MTLTIAEKIVNSISSKEGPDITLSEAQSMTKLATDELEVYGIQKGDVTFLAFLQPDSSVTTKVISW